MNGWLSAASKTFKRVQRCSSQNFDGPPEVKGDLYWSDCNLSRTQMKGGNSHGAWLPDSRHAAAVGFEDEETCGCCQYNVDVSPTG